MEIALLEGTEVQKIFYYDEILRIMGELCAPELFSDWGIRDHSFSGL
jgi:hypothetical protein